MEKSKIFRLLFLNLGISSLLFQVLLLRELVISFYGNEFFVGLILALWLFWAAVGSFLSGKLKKDPHRSLVVLHLFISLFIILSIFFIRFFKIPGTTGGEIPDLFTSLIFVAAILAPVGLAFGSIFTLGVKVWSQAGKAYFWETVGHVIIGLVFNFFLVASPTLPVAFLLAGLNLGLVFLLVPGKTRLSALVFGLVLGLLGIWGGRRLEVLSQSWRFPNLIHQENSLYGHIAVTKSGDQDNFYESGLLVGADEDRYGSEFLVHPVLVQHPKPRRVLLIGGGWNGVLAEILKYPRVEKIDYVELDPRFLQIVEKYLSGDLKKAFSDPRVKKHFVDGRLFLKQTDSTYDVIIFNLPNPSTALINRFYTQECFAEVKRILEPEGLVSLTLSTPTDYLSAETENLLASIYKTLQEEFTPRRESGAGFPQIHPEPEQARYGVKVLAEENVMFLAAKNVKEPKLLDVSEVLKNWKDLNLETSFLTAAELEYRFTNDKNARIQENLKANRGATLNSDFYPAAYFYQTLFWQTKFDFLLPKVLAALQQPVFLGVLGLLLVATFLLVWSARPGLANAVKAATSAVGLGGLTLMAVEIILIFLFQAILGFVYSKTVLLMALVLGGLALGNLVARRWPSFAKATEGKGLLVTQVLIVLYLFFFLRVIPCLTDEIHFYILGIVAGVLVGFIFPLASDAKDAKEAGFLYAADLVGSFFGALLPSLFLIPLFGVTNTVVFLMVVNLVGALGIFYDRRKSTPIS